MIAAGGGGGHQAVGRGNGMQRQKSRDAPRGSAHQVEGAIALDKRQRRLAYVVRLDEPLRLIPQNR